MSACDLGQGFFGGDLERLEFVPSSTLLSTVSEAERAATCIDERVGHSCYAPIIGAFLMDIDAVSSARICGDHVSFRSLFKERFARSLGKRETGLSLYLDLDKGRGEGESLARALRYRSAIGMLYRLINERSKLDISLLARLQSIMLGKSRADAADLLLRSGSGTVLSEGYHAPSAEELGPLLDNLMAFSNVDYSTPLIHSTVTQFRLEAYEPFACDIDSIGRLWSHAIILRRGLLRHVPLPIAMYAAKEIEFHATNLFPYKTTKRFTLSDANDAVERFINGCALSMIYAASVASRMYQEINMMSCQWREVLGEIRRGSALEAIVGALPMTPVFNTEYLCRVTERSETSVNAAIRILLDKGIIQEDGSAKRNRVFLVLRMVKFFDWIESSVFPEEVVSREAFSL